MTSYICIDGVKIELTAEQLAAIRGQVPAETSNGYTLSLISEIAKAGKAREHFKVHDRFVFYGYNLEIIGIGHDITSMGEENTITFRSLNSIEKRRMHHGNYAAGWKDTDLRKWLHKEIFPSLPDELRRCIRTVRKQNHNADGAAYTTDDALWLPSESEAFGSAIYSPAEAGKRYEAFATSENRRIFVDDGESAWQWLRSPVAGSFASNCDITGSGYASTATASGFWLSVPLYFCV